MPSITSSISTITALKLPADSLPPQLPSSGLVRCLLGIFPGGRDLLHTILGCSVLLYRPTIRWQPPGTDVLRRTYDSFLLSRGFRQGPGDTEARIRRWKAARNLGRHAAYGILWRSTFAYWRSRCEVPCFTASPCRSLATNSGAERGRERRLWLLDAPLSHLSTTGEQLAVSWTQQARYGRSSALIAE